ncbi:MAG: A/G-specific adenine glycosylase [Candidatus Azobacteroides pseudotrichonymphae]|jgi:A/G-specific adenine glycosylase|nr:A/G-specific adenine glycosylase [Bacteroidales bacterium OttesenSCG-928-I14]GMO32431.1 MAG: A/G-specific adenine glycosylase [Candidatus Azobacteroides pseudotrichonymphae]
MKDFNFFSKKLITWYSSHKRNLPWRGIYDPYKIWISEVILQQTRVTQGLKYYNRFIKRFPDIESLAGVEEQEVLKYWQGLGYYSRARNLHRTAKTIMDKYNGVFPKDYYTILKLKGIGEYTASSITSFAWNMPHPTVDGNVFRFLSRLFAIDCPIDTIKGKNHFTELAIQLMDKSKARIFNHAIMEFGALQCIPSSPNCTVCSFKSVCLAYINHTVVQYPVKQYRTKIKEIYFYYFHIHDSDHLYLNMRKEKGIWQNLFEFPLIESDILMDFQQLSNTDQFRLWFPKKHIYHFELIVKNQKHILSHRILYAYFYKVFMKRIPNSFDTFKKVKLMEIDKYPIHRLMQFYLGKILPFNRFISTFE